MKHRAQFTCSSCRRPSPPGESEYTCPRCGPGGIFDCVVTPPADGPLFTESPGIWRYEHLLAVFPRAPRPPLLVGNTPLAGGGRLGDRLGMANLFLKNDTLNPTGSLKDRASAVTLARAAELGTKRVAVASTGNAGSSLAGLGAAMGMPTVIFVPAAAPRGKITQALMYGAQVFAVQGNYDDAFELCRQACEQFGWYNRSTALNPYTIEGKKTVSFEIYEQLGNQAPDAVIVPTGDGCILSGVARGFQDLRRLGLIDRVPRIIAAQAEGSDAISRSLRSDAPVAQIAAHSVADSITVDFPRNGAMAVRDIRVSGGDAVVVSDESILSAAHELAATTGIFAEPAAAATLAGLHAALRDDLIARDERVVLLITGSGLKDIDSAVRAAPLPIRMEASLRSVEQAMAI